MHDTRTTRRTFIKASATLAAGAATASSSAAEVAQQAATPTATDQVPLGKTGVRICRLGMGTGSQGGAVQRELGAAGFERLVRYAYDQGIRYIDTADMYQTHTLIRQSIRDLPREELFIQTKMRWDHPDIPKKPLEVLDRFRRELGTDYIDSLLIHCARQDHWDDALKRMLDAFAEAQEKKIIRVKGVSCHGLAPLRCATGVDWVDVHLVRLNPQGRHVDGKAGQWKEPGDVPAVLREIGAMHAKGRGVIGMKMIGNGDFKNPEDREKAIRFAMQCDAVDAVVIGFASPAEIDEALVRMNRALREKV